MSSRSNKKASLAANIMKQRRETVAKKIDAHRSSKISTIDAIDNSNVTNSEEVPNKISDG